MAVLSEPTATDLVPTIQPSSSPNVPPEILLKIFGCLGEPTPPSHSDAPSDDVDDRDRRYLRNSTLRSAALVCKSWGDAAIATLYTDLRVSWTQALGPKIIRELADPALKVRPRSLRAKFPWDLLKDEISAAMLWTCVASLPTLRVLQVERLDTRWERMPYFTEILRPVFASLEVAILDSHTPGDFAVALLRDVRILHLWVFGTMEERKESSSLELSVLKDLTHLWVAWALIKDADGNLSYTDDSAILRRVDLPSLVALNLRGACTEVLEALASTLGEMASLRSLSIRDNDETALDRQWEATELSFLTPLAKLHLLHLTLPQWPSHNLLAHLPRTIESLCIDSDDRNGVRSRADYDDLRNWKGRYLPALKVLDPGCRRRDENEPHWRTIRATLAAQGVHICSPNDNPAVPLPGKWISDEEW